MCSHKEMVILVPFGGWFLSKDIGFHFAPNTPWLTVGSSLSSSI